MTIKVFEGFAGVGSQHMALRDLGLQHEVVATSDWDYHATLSYNAIHTDNPIDYADGIDDRSIIEYLFKLKISSDGKEPMTKKQIARLSKKRAVYNAFKNTNNLGSITEIDPIDIPDHDLFTYSFPCQDISVAGRQEGLDEDSGTRSGLLWECRKVVVAKRPKFLLMENVKNLASKKHMPNFKKWQEWLESQGYTSYWHFMNAKDYDVPQNRDRTFMISYLGDHKPFDLPEPVNLTKMLKDVLEIEVDEKYYLSDEKVQQLLATIPEIKESSTPTNKLIEVAKINPHRHSSLSNSVMSPYGLCPTIDTMQGGNRQPKVIEKVGNVNPSGRGMNGEVYSETGLAPTLTTNKGEGPKVLIKNATKQGYLEATDGDGIDVSSPTSNTRRGRVQKQMSQTLQTGCQVGVLIANGIYTNDSPEFHRGSLEGLSRTIKANNHDAGVTDGYRIRKLTPLECWRLMDFSDDDFYKAQAVCSNSQLYKQAGNSIVKAVLMAIFSQMFDVKRDKGKSTVAVRLDGDS